MKIVNNYISVVKQYTAFSGRADRSEYWYYVAANAIIIAALWVIGMIIDVSNMLISLYNLAVLLPGLAVSVRRLHDTGRNGLWILVNLIPFVGWIIFVYFAIQEGEPKANEYGPSPTPGNEQPQQTSQAQRQQPPQQGQQRPPEQ